MKTRIKSRRVRVVACRIRNSGFDSCASRTSGSCSTCAGGGVASQVSLEGVWTSRVKDKKGGVLNQARFQMPLPRLISSYLQGKPGIL